MSVSKAKAVRMSNSVATHVTKDFRLPRKCPCKFPTRDSKKPLPPAKEPLIKELQLDPFSDKCLLNDIKQHQLNPSAKEFVMWDFYQALLNDPAEAHLMRDFKILKLHPPTGISASPQTGNIFLWDAVILGPEETMWEGGIFKLTLQFPKEYRNMPPTVRFVSQMFHPNIDENGTVNDDLLKNKWSATFDVAAILTSIQEGASLEAAKLEVNNRNKQSSKFLEMN